MNEWHSVALQTEALEIEGVGVLVRSTGQNGKRSAPCFVPGARIVRGAKAGTYMLAPDHRR